MPRSIAEIRQANGGLDTLTDEDILQAEYGRHKAYYPSIEDFASDVGYEGVGRGKWGSRLSSSIDSYQAGLYGLGEAVSGAAGITGAEDYFARGREQNEAAAQYASQRAREQGAIESYKDIGGVGDFFDYAGGLGVQSLPYFGEAITGGVAGRALLTGAKVGLSRGAASTTGAIGASYPSSVADILQSQREQSGETDLLSAGILGAPYAGLNALGIEGALARGSLTRSGIKALDEMTGVKGAAARTAATVAKSAPVEAASETGQEIINQFGRMAVDPTTGLITPEAVERYKESFVGGLVLGGAFSGAAGGWRRTEEGGTDLTAPETPRLGLEDTGALGESLTGTGVASMLGQRSPGLTGQLHHCH